MIMKTDFWRGVNWARQHERRSDGSIPFFEVLAIDKQQQAVAIRIDWSQKQQPNSTAPIPENIEETSVQYSSLNFVENLAHKGLEQKSDSAKSDGQSGSNCIIWLTLREGWSIVGAGQIFCGIDELFLCLFSNQQQWHAQELDKRLKQLLKETDIAKEEL